MRAMVRARFFLLATVPHVPGRSRCDSTFSLGAGRVSLSSEDLESLGPPRVVCGAPSIDDSSERRSEQLIAR
jgi:hypothetical protein